MASDAWGPGRHGRWFLTGGVALAALAASGASPVRGALLEAQSGPRRVLVVPLVATAIHDLTFGSVLPGIPSTVPVADTHNSGLFEISGPATASIRVEFVLPTALVSGGASLPLVFGGGDGFADFTHLSPPSGISFDPHGPLLGALGPDGQLFVRLGGTVFPVRGQISGAYAATITLTVYNLGS